MTIASEITRINNNIANAYTACNGKGATMPVAQNSANLADCIDSISTGGSIDSLTVNPSTSQQTITASGGVDGYSPITVNAVTSAIDNNITSGNIKDGITILGVSGSVIELEGETRTEQLNSTSGNTFIPSTGKNGITSITVTPKNYNRTVAAGTTARIYAVPSNYSGHGEIKTEAVTASIDNNIQAGNIKDGVTILGVTGTYTGGGSSKYGATANSLLGDVDSNGVLQFPTAQTNLVFTGVEEVESFALQYKFYRCYGVATVSFPDLTSLNHPGTVAGYEFYYAFTDCNLTSIDFPVLATVGSQRAFQRAFAGSTLPTATFTSLATISGQYAFQNAFSDCTSLTTLSFPALTSTAFGSYTNQFNNMLLGVTGCTVHFPSNLQSVIGSWSSVTAGFGGTNTTVLFDLPATT